MAARKSMKSRFAERLTAVGGHAVFAKDGSAALARMLELVSAAGASNVSIERSAYLDTLELKSALTNAGFHVLDDASDRLELAKCEVGIAAVDFAIAESGTLVHLSGPGRARAVSLLPAVQIALVPMHLLVESLVDVLERVPEGGAMPSCLTLATGPSRTADIEQVLTIGVHGPCAVHAILVG